jgi:chromosome segregation protein
VQFTRLRLVGFKSFVDPTELVIEHGLTGVVGPNGCGKSNLLEALRWVMGENRPTAMRGDGMEDVIFAGSSARPARGYAEVVLRIDNSARRAPAAFNAQDELEVSRRITRAVGSVYRVNGREARARDVQLLFADAASGATSPSLVRQGQISELINARPKARRRVLEEAAGISGLYARRHEAELKLRATEANLARVGDVIDALEVQIASLARQARAAARYREIAEALRRAEALHLLKVWHEAEADRAAAAAALAAALTDLARAEGEASRTARARDATAEALPALREEDAIAGAVLQRTRLEGEKLDEERARAERTIADLAGQLDQIGRDEAREAALDADAGETLAVLERERAGLEAAGEGEAQRVVAARDAVEMAGATLEAVQGEADAVAGEAAALGARHEAARRVLGEARARLAGAERQAEEAERAHGGLSRELAGAEAARAAAAEAAAGATGRATAAEAALREAEAAAEAAGTAEAEARAARAAGEGESAALAREHGALAAMLDRERPKHRPMLEAITVRPGYERAVGAAFGDDLGFGEAGGGDTGWLALDPLEAVSWPEGVELLVGAVEGPAALARRLAAVGVVDRAAGPALQARLARGQRLVSREGDLWRWDGLAVSAGAAPSGAALRLEQRNRLAALAAALATAKEASAGAVAAHAAAAAAAGAARAAEAAARAERKAADQAASEAARALGRAETAREALAARVAGLEAGLGRRRQEIAAARAALAEAEAEVAGMPDLEAARAAVGQLRGALETARAAMLAARGEADAVARAAKAREARIAAVAGEVEGWVRRRGSAGQRLADLARRRADIEAALGAARAVPEALGAARAKLGTALEEASARHRRAADALALGETAAREAEAAARAADRAASDAREARARAEARAEAAGTRLAEAAARVEAEAGTPAEALAARLTVDWAGLSEAAALKVEVERLTRARDGLGAVNLRAEEDAKAAEAERDALAEEKADLEAAIAKLRHGIGQLNREGRGRLLAAFDQVNARFGELFRTLFGGGEASLVLVDSDDPLDAGLEIMAQPPGKKLSTLSLLSGGEQTLTALSLIFAVFLANPAPICVLDEVDAPLDDANVTRFCDLLDEMTRLTDTRFLIITHHAVTMARMDRLFGVTMVEKGVSQLVSVDLAAAERIVEPV